MNDTIKEWEALGVIQRWELARQNPCEEIPTVVCPLSVEPEKPRAVWDGRYLNEYIRDIPFSMDGVNKVAEIAWKNAYMFKLDHQKWVLSHIHCREFKEIFWNLLGWNLLCLVCLTFWMEIQSIHLPHIN